MLPQGGRGCGQLWMAALGIALAQQGNTALALPIVISAAWAKRCKPCWGYPDCLPRPSHALTQLALHWEQRCYRWVL